MNKCPQCLNILSENVRVCHKCGYSFAIDTDETKETKILEDKSMTPKKWEKVKKLFVAAEKLTGDKREKFLAQECGDDPELRREVEKLLDSNKDDSFLEATAIAEVPSLFDEKTQIKEADKTQSQIHKTTSDSAKLVEGTILAERYRVLGLLGKGGMGEVYKALDIKLDQTVALKFLPEKLSKNEDALRRFIGEVKTARQVAHENVCKVFDIGEVDGKQFISMEFIEGDDLSMLLNRIGRLPSDKAIEISRQICMGLNAIHKTGILHRDLKPANIIIDSKGKARITDFGIAGFEEDLQGAEARVGTPAYMSPEQITGREVTQKSDIYSLGLLIYEIFTGKQAVRGDSLNEIIDIHQSQTPTNPSDFVENIDPLVEKIIERCLEKNPENRPASAVQVALALPGGNPLQVALEAGETPTPEMVAAAPVKGILKPSVAIGMLAFVIAVVSLSFYVSSNYSAAGRTPFERSPEALAERARTVIRNFGYSETPNDSHYEIGLDPSYKSFAKTRENPNSWWEKIETGQPFQYYFWYRQSPQRLLPLGIFKNIRINNPPVTVPGMINVELDVKGRLIEFKAVPPSQVPQNASSEKIDWQKVFGEAGLDHTKFEEVDPKLNPTVFFDENREWKGTLSDHPDIPLRIRAAAFNGRLVEFRAVPVWKESSDLAGQTNNSGGTSWFEIITIGLIWIVYLGSLFLAYSNWKKGRTDISGTIKLALFGFLPNFLFYFILNDRYTLYPGTSLYPISGIAPFALEAALWLSIFYLALEPFVRRYWSDLLISWNRILKGDFRNPIIGRDLLAGFFLYAIAHSISIGVEFLVTELNPALLFDRFYAVDTFPLNGTAKSVALILAYIPFSLIAAFFLFPLLVIGHLIFKKKSSVIIAVFLFFSIQTVVGVIDGSRAGRYEDLFTESVWLVLIFWASFRYGFVAAVAYSLLYGLLLQFTVTIDPSRYYFSSTVILAVTILVIAVYACYISMGNQVGKTWLKEDT